MKLLVFDTETTGLPKSKESADKNPNNWPHIVSISWVILENDKIIKEASYIIYPQAWSIPPESTKIHGITDSKARECGTQLKFVMEEFMLENYDYMVAHNLNFDYNVLVNAIKWDLHKDVFLKPGFCTMNLSKNLCKIQGQYGYKYPKLKELYFYVFKKYPEENLLHSSLYDTKILCEILQTSSELRKEIGLVTSNANTDNGIYPKTLSIKF